MEQVAWDGPRNSVWAVRVRVRVPYRGNQKTNKFTEGVSSGVFGVYRQPCNSSRAIGLL